MVDYKSRVVDAQIRDALRRAGAVLVEGPKACGKTWTALQVAQSDLRLDEQYGQLTGIVEVDPSLLLEGATPRLLDEWQIYPQLWNMVRRAVDDRQVRGQFILTGSSTPDDDARRHTGAGRFAVIHMRPMSLFESGHSSGQVSLRTLFTGEAPRAFDPAWSMTHARRFAAERVSVGGWPINLILDVDDALAANRDYVDVVRRYDIQRATGARRDPEVALKVMRSLARGISTQMSELSIAHDVYGDGQATAEAQAAAVRSEIAVNPELVRSGIGFDATSRDAVRTHLDALRRLRLVEDLPAWGPHMRSARRVSTTPKRHYADPSLAVAALGMGLEEVARDVLSLGFLFESLVVRDLRVYVEALAGRVSHYRDASKLEVDAVLELPDGRWAGVEVKLGSTQRAVDAAAGNLLALRDRVGGERCAFIAVVTNGGAALRRPDGVDVVPLAMLGP